MNKTRKTDRRTLYTCMVIKEAFLSMLSEKEYREITVTDVCRKAEINRSTFYLHYANLHVIMNELIDDAFAKMHSVLVQVGCEPAQEKKCSYPLCRFLRENRKYQPLFFSDTLHSHVIDRLVDYGWEDFAGPLQKQSGLSEDVLKEVLRFQLNGCLAISKHNITVSNDTWSEIQCSIDRILKSGYKSL